MQINRDQAIELLHSEMQNQNLRRHCYCVEAVMRALARNLNSRPAFVKDFGEASEEKWGILGLLHDGDYEVTKEDWTKHTLLMIEWLAAREQADPDIVKGLQSHNAERTGFPQPETPMEWALACCDELTGFIVAVALVRPDKKLAAVEVDSVLKKFPNKEFARAVNRDDITRCEEKLGIPLREFVQITLDAMKGIANEIGL